MIDQIILSALKLKETQMLLLLSHFSRVQLCETPQMAAHQASPSLGFSRQEHWSGLPFPSPMHESVVTQSCPTLPDPMDRSLPGSSVHGIFQARVLESGAIGTLVYLDIIFFSPASSDNITTKPFYLGEFTLSFVFIGMDGHMTWRKPIIKGTFPLLQFLVEVWTNQRPFLIFF